MKNWHIATIATILVGLIAITCGVVGLALSAYTLGSMDYSKENAQAYIKVHCDYVPNQYNSNAGYYACER